MTRVLLFLCICLPCAGTSAFQWLVRYALSRTMMNEQDRGRVEHDFGINGPGMDATWVRLRHGDVDHRPYSFHLLKDVMSEWVKTDAQRGGKFLSMVALFWFIVAALCAVALALVGAL